MLPDWLITFFPFTWGLFASFGWITRWLETRKLRKKIEEMRSLHDKAVELEEYLRREWHENILLDVRIHLELIMREFPDLGQRHERYDFRAVYQELLQARSLRWQGEELQSKIESLKKSRRVKEMEVLKKQLSTVECRATTAEMLLRKIRDALG